MSTLASYLLPAIKYAPTAAALYTCGYYFFAVVDQTKNAHEEGEYHSNEYENRDHVLLPHPDFINAEDEDVETSPEESALYARKFQELDEAVHRAARNVGLSKEIETYWQYLETPPKSRKFGFFYIKDAVSWGMDRFTYPAGVLFYTQGLPQDFADIEWTLNHEFSHIMHNDTFWEPAILGLIALSGVVFRKEILALASILPARFAIQRFSERRADAFAMKHSSQAGEQRALVQFKTERKYFDIDVADEDTTWWERITIRFPILKGDPHPSLESRISLLERG